MKTSAVIRIITWSIVAIFLIAFLTNSIGSNKSGFGNFPIINLGNFNYNFDNASKYSIADGKINADDIRKLDIDWVSGKVRIEEYNGKTIEFYEESTSSLSEDNKMRYLVDGGTLKIRFRKPYTMFGAIKSLNKTLVIRIPVSMEDGLAELKLENVSSIVEIEALIANVAVIESVSGEINIKNLISKKLDIETISGDVNLSANLEHLNLETISGDVDISIDSNSIEKIDMESVSGELSLKMNSCPKKLDIETVSGEVDIFIPENDGFAVEYETISGKFKCDFEVSLTKKQAIYKDGKSKSMFDIETISGNISINKK